MKIKTLLHFILQNPILLMYRINKTTRELYRAGFIATAISEGIYTVLSNGPASCRDIQEAIGADANQEGLEAWLDLGVSLGELAKNDRRYSIKSSFSKDLLKASNDTWQAFLQARVEIFYNYIIKTPGFLKQGKHIEFSESYGELFARSSRTVEPILFDIVDRLVPPNEACHLLEVGCGSGLYIKRACERNPHLIATGLELQSEVAEFARKNILHWKIAERVTIETIDIRKYQQDEKYDIVTLYNLIYYFPINERVALLRHISTLLKPGGILVLTTLCPHNDPSIQAMNLWSSMTAGCGPLPSPDHVAKQLQEAGFANIQVEKLIPSFYLFKTQKSN